jgi:hypothetical protein
MEMKLKKNFNQIARLPAFWIIAALLTAGIASNLASGQAGEDSETISSTLAEQSQLLREGTRVESRLANCRSAGERLLIEFVDDTRQLVALENLASQRVLKAVMDDASDSKWIINGLITEFQERNYLLLDRVSRASRE